jgi:hypothetical protein
MVVEMTTFINERFLLTIGVLGAYVACSLYDTHGHDITNVLTTLQNALLMCLTYYFHSLITERQNGHV